MENYLGFKYSEVVADAGYESEENYLFIEKNGQTGEIDLRNYKVGGDVILKQPKKWISCYFCKFVLDYSCKKTYYIIICDCA